MSPLVSRLPIDSADVWAEALNKEHKRQDVTSFITACGFNVKDSAFKLKELYRKLHKEAKAK